MEPREVSHPRRVEDAEGVETGSLHACRYALPPDGVLGGGDLRHVAN